MPSRKLPGSGNAKDPSGSAPSSGSRATTAAAQQQRLRNFLLAGVAVLVLAFIVAWLGGASGRGGTAHFAEDLPDLVFDEGKLPGYKKKNVSLADSDLVAEWLRQQDGFRDAARFLKRAGFDSSARYVQTCFESTGVATRPHIIILSFFLQSLGFVHLGESSLNICEEGSRETPEVEQMLEEVKRRSGLLVVNSYGADCVKGSICGADAPRLRSVLCLCRPAGWAADKITQHRAFVAMDNALDALEGPAPPAGELGALLAEFRRMLPRGLRASDVRPATWTVSDEAEARQILEGMSQGKFRKGLFAKPSLSLKSVGAVPLPTAQHVRQWMSDVGFPVPQPYIVQELVERPMLIAGRASIFRSYVAVLSLSPPRALFRLGRVNVGAHRFYGENVSTSERYVVNSMSALMPFSVAVSSTPSGVAEKLAKRIKEATSIVVGSLMFHAFRRHPYPSAERTRTLSHICVDLMMERGAPKVLEVNSNCGMRLIGVDYSDSLAADLGIDLGINAFLQSLDVEGDRTAPLGGWETLFA